MHHASSLVVRTRRHLDALGMATRWVHRQTVIGWSVSLVGQAAWLGQSVRTGAGRPTKVVPKNKMT